MAGGWVMMGPWVTQDDAMKNIVQSELKLKGPQKFSGQLPQPNTVDGYYRDVMVQAFRSREKTTPIDPKDIIDITDRWRADRTFQWDVPEGEWTILRTGYTLTGSKWEPYPMGDTFRRRGGLSDRLHEQVFAGQLLQLSRQDRAGRSRDGPAGGWPISGPTVGSRAN